MKVSVIIPVFNNERYLAETLESVKNQSYKNWECIIVDDGSNDDSEEIAQSFCQDSKFQFIKREQNYPKGANACRNLGAHRSTGDFYLFLDGDDLLSEDCLEKRIVAYEDEDLFICNSGVFDGEISRAKLFFPSLRKDLKKEDYLGLFLEYLTPWNIHSPIWSGVFFKKLGGFDEGLQRFQDVDIHIRALSSEHSKIGFDKTDTLTSYYRKSEFHQKMSLDKRRFLLDQGLLFVAKVKDNVKEELHIRLQGLLMYLQFRFEEVFEEKDSDRVHFLTEGILGENSKDKLSKEFQFVRFLYEKVITRPSKVRKILSYGAFRMYSGRLKEQILA